MEPATEKQIKFANSLGIENPQNYSKMEIKGMIDDKLQARNGGTKKPSYNAPQAPQSPQTSRHDIVIEKREKPHSYEFGKPTSRFKIYYETVVDLKKHLEELKESGFLEDPVDNFEVPKEVPK